MPVHKQWHPTPWITLPSFFVKDESILKMSHVDHIPQTLASHGPVPKETHTRSQHGADMLQPDPRDTFFNSKPLSVCSAPLSGTFLFYSSVSLLLLGPLK